LYDITSLWRPASTAILKRQWSVSNFGLVHRQSNKIGVLYNAEALSDPRLV
jgi:hypothetical protein